MKKLLILLLFSIALSSCNTDSDTYCVVEYNIINNSDVIIEIIDPRPISNPRIFILEPGQNLNMVGSGGLCETGEIPQNLPDNSFIPYIYQMTFNVFRDRRIPQEMTKSKYWDYEASELFGRYEIEIDNDLLSYLFMNYPNI